MYGLPVLLFLGIFLATSTASVAEESFVSITKKATGRQQSAQARLLKQGRKWLAQNPATALQWTGPDFDADLSSAAVPIAFTDRHGNTRHAVLDPKRDGVRGIGHVQLESGDKTQLLAFYQRVWAALPSAQREGLVPAASLERASKRTLLRALGILSDRLTHGLNLVLASASQVGVIPGLTANPIGDCTSEVGWEDGGDDGEFSDRCDVGEYATHGLMANVTWPLKDDVTCIKDQGERGTCGAHAIVAAMESHLLAHGGVAENLGEQNLYFWAKVNTDWPDRYQDGIQIGDTLDALVAGHYVVRYEAAWNYNRSTLRAPFDAATSSFPDSCLFSYHGELCTDFAFQGTEDLTRFPARYGHPDYGTSGGREVAAWSYVPVLPGFTDPAFPAATAALLLQQDTPVMAGMYVPPAFLAPSPDGYVNHVAGQQSQGVHGVLAVGFVTNDQLPAGAPPDPAGVGYFIVKNAWSTAYADCGLVYASYDFMTRWVFAWSFLTDVR